ncbi:MAG: 2-phosphosulfolactate phosphatase [Deltaproteobacteria bacterium]|nr:MAG: 2-phosphosulfolactate phosphatase [Deltaproteobacteria bacterium]
MKIIRESLAEGAKRAKGITIIIDVFRAFTSTPLFFHLGAQKVIFVYNPDEAFSLKSNHDDIVLAGEINEELIPGFDLGNSPSELIKKPQGFLKGKKVVQRTTAGVNGVIIALGQAEIVILGSYVMAQAISRYILSQDPLPEVVTIVAMGSLGVTRAPEDEGCADYLEHLLAGSDYDHLKTLRGIIFSQAAQKFMRGDKVYLPREDPLLCLQRDLFDFVLIASKENGLVTVTKKEFVG